MKKGLLLTTAALCAMGAMAQTDYAPENWRYNDMQAGSAEGLFIKELVSTESNAKAPFRAADNGKGGIVAISWGGESASGTVTSDYNAIDQKDKDAFESFYKSSRIVSTNLVNIETQESTPENLFCIIGKNATSTYPGGEQATVSFPELQLMWLSGNENSTTPLQLGKNYRLTIDYRVIHNDPNFSGKIGVTIATSAYDGIDQNTGLGDGSYRMADLPVYGSYPDDWNRGIFDIMLFDNTDASYKELPFAVKLNVKFWDNAVVLFRSMKLEMIDEIDSNNVPANVNDYPDYVDKPEGGTTSVEQLNIKDSGVIFAENGAITVIDANAPVEVYNIAGAKVASVAAPSTVETIELGMNGVFVVKVGDKVQKVIL